MTVGPWIQPDDMVLQRYVTRVGGQAHDAYFDDPDVLFTFQPGTPFLFAPDNYPVAGKIGGPAFRWYASMPFFNVGSLAADAVYVPPVGDWPPTATGVELEADVGVLVSGTCHTVGTGRWSQSLDNTQTWGITVRRYPRTGYDFAGSLPTLPGDDSGSPSTPDLPVLYGSGDVVASLASLPDATTFDFDWLLADPDAEGWTALLLLPNASFGAVSAALGWADTTIHAVDLSNDGATPPYVAATFTPPRYRFTLTGRTPLRGRQRASGVMGTVPLRGRQGDKWGLRGRQNSNL